MELRPIISALMRNKVAPMLVAIQIAISLAILTNALYIVNLNIAKANRPTGVAHEENMFNIAIASNRQLTPEEKVNQDQRFFQIISAVPGVQSVADISELPLTRSGRNDSISLAPNQTKSSANTTIYASAHSVIKTFGLNLVAGRDFNESDVEDANPDAVEKGASQVIMTQALARQLYPGETNFIGKTILWGGGADSTPAQIIGVVERMQDPFGKLEESGEFSLLTPYRRKVNTPLYAIRAQAGQRDRVMAEVEASLRKSSTAPLLIRMRSMEDDRKTMYGADMTLVWMLIIVSALLVIVTASGIVGMTSLWVSQRTKQIGVRRALGARKIDILRYFITENVVIGCAGVVSGSVLAIGLNQFLVSQLELSKIPLYYIGFGAGLFLLLGLGAAYAPAFRAASISPAVATRGT